MKSKTKKRKNYFKKLNKNQKIGAIVGLVIDVVIVLVVIIALTSGKGRISPNPLLELDKDVAFGVDVSEYNSDIDWAELKDEVDFVIVRVGYTGYGTGKMMIDENAEENLKQANKYDIPVGVYYYSQATTVDEAKDEAKKAFSVIKNYDISLPVFIDFEYPTESGQRIGRLANANLSPSENANIINVFCNTIKNLGYQSGVYSSTSIFENDIETSSIDDDYYIWVGDYNSEITYSGDYDLWQYSENGILENVSSKDIDLDYWYIKK